MAISDDVGRVQLGGYPIWEGVGRAQLRSGKDRAVEQEEGSLGMGLDGAAIDV